MRGTQVLAQLASLEKVPGLQAEALPVQAGLQAPVLQGVQALQQDAVEAVCFQAPVTLRVSPGEARIQMRQLAPARAAGVGPPPEALQQVQPEGKGAVEEGRQKLASRATAKSAPQVPRRGKEPGAAEKVPQRHEGHTALDAAALSSTPRKQNRLGRQLYFGCQRGRRLPGQKASSAKEVLCKSLPASPGVLLSVCR